MMGIYPDEARRVPETAPPPLRLGFCLRRHRRRSSMGINSDCATYVALQINLPRHTLAGPFPCLNPPSQHTLVTRPFSTERPSHRVGTGFADGDQAITQDIGGGQILSATKHDRNDVPHRMLKGPSAPGNAKRGRGASTGAGRLSTCLHPESKGKCPLFKRRCGICGTQFQRLVG